MKASKFEEVGHIRRRSGISMKMRMKPDTLGDSSVAGSPDCGIHHQNRSHEYYAEDD
jgi:hypothetical protein